MSEKELNILTKEYLEDIKKKNKTQTKRLYWIVGLLVVFVLSAFGKTIAIDAKQSSVIVELPSNYMTYEKFMEYNELLNSGNELLKRQVALNSQLIESKCKENSETYKRIEEQINSVNKQLLRIYDEIDFIKENYKPKERGIVKK
jgi:hypothetical protein